MASITDGTRQYGDERSEAWPEATQAEAPAVWDPYEVWRSRVRDPRRLATPHTLTESPLPAGLPRSRPVVTLVEDEPYLLPLLR